MKHIHILKINACSTLSSCQIHLPFSSSRETAHPENISKTPKAIKNQSLMA